MKSTFIILAAVLVVAAGIGYNFSLWGVETPAYTVLQQEGSFEIREYPHLTLVSTAMENPDPESGDSFMRLFRYISGENQTGTAIAMTTPVITSEDNGERAFSFIVPEEVTERGIPAAISEAIEFGSLSSGRFATYRFDGEWGVRQVEEAKEALESWLLEQDLIPQGEPMIARYDPPYFPDFLKRNEILVRVDL